MGIPKHPLFDEKLIHDTNIELRLESHSADDLHIHPDLLWKLDFSDISIYLSERQVHLLRAIVEENVCDTFEEQKGLELKPLSPQTSHEQEKLQPQDAHQWLKDKYFISIAKVSIHLFAKDGIDLVTSEPLSLVSASTSQLQAEINFTYDDTITGTYTLDDLTILDTRMQSANKFRHILTAKPMTRTSYRSNSYSPLQSSESVPDSIAKGEEDTKLKVTVR